MFCTPPSSFVVAPLIKPVVTAGRTAVWYGVDGVRSVVDGVSAQYRAAQARWDRAAEVLHPAERQASRMALVALVPLFLVVFFLMGAIFTRMVIIFCCIFTSHQGDFKM